MKHTRYAIRKTLLGVGSVAIGSFMLTAQVEASEAPEGIGSENFGGGQT